MTEYHSIQSHISAYAAKFLKDHYGESPSEIEVIFQNPFLLIHLQGFLLAPEELLISRRESKRVLESRNLLMTSLNLEKKSGFESVFEWRLQEIFSD